jgi:putative flavoprotein involved in K+ transport
LFGRDVFSWLVCLGLITAPTESRRARRLRKGGGDLVIGTSRRRLRRLGVTTHPALVDANDATARFADGSSADVAGVIWATGFRTDHSFVDPDLTGDPQLHFIGLPWQRSRGSALLGFVGADAVELADAIAQGRRVAQAPGRSTGHPGTASASDATAANHLITINELDDLFLRRGPATSNARD